jgi:hypothetical protein
VLLFLRIYAVVYLVLFLESLLFALRAGSQLTIIEIVDMMFFTPVAVLSLWSAGYRHLNLPKNTWKILLFASVFWRPLAVGNAVLFGTAIPKFQAFMAAITAKMSSQDALAVNLFAIGGICFAGSVVILPPLIALYRNAYGDESLLKLVSPFRPAQVSSDPQERLAKIAAAREAQRVL